MFLINNQVPQYSVCGNLFSCLHILANTWISFKINDNTGIAKTNM